MERLITKFKFFVGFLLILLNTACFTPWAGNEETSLSISLLGTTSGNARVATGFNSAVILADLDWSISMTDRQSDQVRYAEINAAGTHATVTDLYPGSWDILVETSIFNYPYAKGEIPSFRVSSGRNTANVEMQRLPNAIALNVATDAEHTFPPATAGDFISPYDMYEITVYNFTGSDPVLVTATLEDGRGFTVPASLSIMQDSSTELTIAPNTAAAGDFEDTLTISANGNVIATIRLSLEVYANPGASLAITFDQITDAAPEITGPTLSRSGTGALQTEIITVLNPANYESISWHIYGTTSIGATFTLSVDPSNPAYTIDYDILGPHFLTLEVFIDGIPYNKTIVFTIVP